MGLEAVPCVLRSAANDGNNSSYCTIGFLIRPSTSSTNNTTGQTVSNASVSNTASVAVPSGNVPKSLHVVPATIQKQSAALTTTAPKLVVPSVLRIQPTPCTSTHLAPPPPQPIHHPAPPKPSATSVQHHHLQPQQQQHCGTDGWLHAAPRSNVSSGSFESPSPSQVVPQMNVNESYDCQMPCTSTTPFFPPISSITQSFSSSKSDIDLLQDMTHHVDLNPPIMHQQQSQHVSDKTVMITSHYAQQHNITPPPPPQQRHYHSSAPSIMHMPDPSTCTPVQTNYQTHMQMEINGGMQSCHYQNNYSVVADCSPTTDSGIQSIADSPPADPFTPPTSYIPPTPVLGAVNKTKEPQISSDTTTCSDDYSDMPRLIPFHQMETESSSPLAEELPPFMTKASPSESAVIETAEATTAGSYMENEGGDNSEKYHEISTISKEKSMKELDDGIPKIAITPAMNVTDLVEQLMSHMDPEQRKQFASAIQSKVGVDCTTANSSAITTTVTNFAESITTTATAASATVTFVATAGTADIITPTVNAAITYGNKAVELLAKEPEHEVAVQTEFMSTSKVELYENRSVESESPEVRNQIQEKKQRFRKRKMEDCNESILEKPSQKMKRREARYRSNDTVVKSSRVDGLDIDEEENRLRPLSSRSLVVEQQPEERRCRGRKKQEERKKYIAEKKFPTKKLEKKRVIGEEAREEHEARKDVIREADMCSECSDESMMDQIREFHLDMKRKVNEQLKIIIEQVGKQFSTLELNLGEREHWDLPWYRLNWKEVTRRLVERNRIERSAREKNTAKTGRNSGDRKLPKSKKSDSFVASAIPSSSKLYERSRRSPGDYIKLKQNVIIDAYPKIEQMQCSCSSGCCGESDECLNRVVLMECGSSCPRNSFCTNKRLFRRECVERLRTFQTTNGCGIGVKTDVNIDKGQFICEYIGEVVSMETFNIRSRTDYRYQRNHYALNLCPGFVVDAYRKGNIARFINHSCAPNCEMQRWSVNGQYRIGLFALRGIRADEELTYDYNWDAFEFDDVTICCCGAPNCRHFLNKNVIMNNREKELVRNTRLLLLRNIRKSAAWKLRKFGKGYRSRSQSRISKSSLSISPTDDSEAHLAQLCREVVKKFEDSKVASKKQLKKLSNFVEELRVHQTSMQTTVEILESIEVKINTLLGKSTRPLDRRKLDIWRASFASIKSGYLRQARKSGKIDHHQSPRKSRTGPHRTLAAVINYRYLDSPIPVGSYDHDSFSFLSLADANTDCVRCICGTTDDDGPMIQCEKCNFWLHEECVFNEKPDEVKDFICILCIRNAQRTSVASIPLRIQPDYNFKNCTYYRTLVNSRHLQVRLSETVYVQKLENDNHKLILRRLVECTKQGVPLAAVIPTEQEACQIEKPFYPVSFHRQNVRCFRIERLFSFEGHKFVFGFYYARPHEVYCEPGKLFHEKELFATSMYDTLPLDAVVGRCLALEPSIYCLGRPKLPHYEEVPFVMEKEIRQPFRWNAAEYNSLGDRSRQQRMANLETVLQSLPRTGKNIELLKTVSCLSDKSSRQKRLRTSRY
uniref:Histone-lysine N-methyltransferase n=1 Tax=Setaria digitata TaxID=48799 RepID=A0A915PES9_9BILA